ncbi:MAG: hypothetical protein AB8C84_02945 [Oligoflexales bacterium]
MTFSKDDEKELSIIMNTRYAACLNDRRFHLSTSVEKNTVAAKVTLENSDQSFHYPVEARMMISEDSKLSVFDATAWIVDAIDMYFDEYLNGDESTFLPIDWTEFSTEGHIYQMRGQVMNRKLEDLGDEWLKLHGSDVVEGADHEHDHNCSH